MPMNAQDKFWPWLTERRAFALCGALSLLAVALRMGWIA